ncbi:MAG: hypothetical protein ACFFAO_09020 [Candidatus Hermodarchaeota archaeon]
MDIRDLSNTIRDSLEGQPTVEAAGQKFVTTMYDMLKESIVLLRLFVAIQYRELPRNIQSFADKLAGTANIKLQPDNYVLTLFGTIGQESGWHVRASSQGHQGIPLPTGDFVAAIPMMSALLEQLGFNLGWIRGEPDIVAQHVGKLMGSFYVADAATTKDSKGRNIIAAQDFVRKYGVKTVFGFGGGFASGGKMLTVICFLNETIEKKQAVYFQSLGPVFIIKSQRLVLDKKYF